MPKVSEGFMTHREMQKLLFADFSRALLKEPEQFRFSCTMYFRVFSPGCKARPQIVFFDGIYSLQQIIFHLQLASYDLGVSVSIPLLLISPHITFSGSWLLDESQMECISVFPIWTCPSLFSSKLQLGAIVENTFTADCFSDHLYWLLSAWRKPNGIHLSISHLNLSISFL